MIAFEYLSANIDDTVFNYMEVDLFDSQAHTIDSLVIRDLVLDQLAFTPGLEGFRPTLDRISMMLNTMPNMALRDVELSLLQEGKVS